MRCVKCGSTLGFDSNALSIITIENTGSGGEDDEHPIFRQFNGNGDTTLLRYCANAEFGVCNWLTLEADSNTLCKACDLNRMIPNLSEPGGLEAWRDLERAKKAPRLLAPPIWAAI